MGILLDDLEEKEAAKLLDLVLYGMVKHPRRYVLLCLCGNRSEDIRKNKKAWYGWQIIPTLVCPECIAKKEEK